MASESESSPAAPTTPPASKPQKKAAPQKPAANKKPAAEAPAAPAPAAPAPRKNRSQHIRTPIAAPEPAEGPKTLADLTEEYFAFDDDGADDFEPREPAAPKAKTPEDPTELSDQPLKTKPDSTAAPAASTGDPSSSSEPAPRGISKLLLRRAEAVGLSADDLVGEEPERVERYVESLEARHFGPRPAPKAAAEPEKPAEPEIDWGTSPDGTKLTDADFDPGVVRAMKSLRAENTALKQQVEQVAQHLTREQAQKQIGWIESQFEAMSGTHGGVFGKGTIEEIGTGSPEALRRRAVLATVTQMAQADQQAGRPVNHAKLFRQVAEQLFGAGSTPKGDPAAGPAAETKPANQNRPRDPKTNLFLSDDEIEAQDREKARWAAGELAEPTSRRGAREPDPRKRGTKAIAAYLHENGVYQPDNTEETELPGDE